VNNSVCSVLFVSMTEIKPVGGDAPSMNQILKLLHMERTVRIPTKSRQIFWGGHSIQFFEQPGKSVRSTFSDSCSPLLKYLEENKSLFQGKKVIELGGGIGLIGILCALLGADVVVTDHEDLLPLIRQNIATNTSLCHKISAIALNWGDDVSSLQPPFDFIIASEVIHQKESFQSLINSFDLLSDFETKILVSYKRKFIPTAMFLAIEPRPSEELEQDFFQYLADNFSRTQLSSYQSGKSTVFLLKKKRKWKNFN